MKIRISSETFCRTFAFNLMDFPVRAFSPKNVPLDWGKNCELLDSFLSFHLNRKPLLSKIASVMESTAMAEGHYQQTMAILS